MMVPRQHISGTRGRQLESTEDKRHHTSALKCQYGIASCKGSMKESRIYSLYVSSLSPTSYWCSGPSLFDAMLFS